MKNYKNIKRLFEQEAVSSADVAEFGLQPEMEFPVQEQPELELPAEGESTVSIDPLTMTVKDFLDKCKSIEPLVCMGIESFIEKNREAITGGSEEMTTPDQDLTFSNVIEPTEEMPAQAEPFSLDQSQDALNFPA